MIKSIIIENNNNNDKISAGEKNEKNNMAEQIFKNFLNYGKNKFLISSLLRVIFFAATTKIRPPFFF